MGVQEKVPSRVDLLRSWPESGKPKFFSEKSFLGRKVSFSSSKWVVESMRVVGGSGLVSRRSVNG